MRIKKFVDEDMIRLMRRVKEELGATAVIVSTAQLADGRNELVAAVENDDLDFNEEQILPLSSAYCDRPIRERLDYHEVGEKTRGKLLSLCRRQAENGGLQDDLQILTAVLTSLFGCYELADSARPVKVFAGAPGRGKTTALVKTAAMAKRKGFSCAIVSADGVRAGTNEQLAAFAKILKFDFCTATTAEKLSSEVAAQSCNHRLVLVDLPGLSPFEKDDLKKLTELISAAGGETFMTLDAGYNAYDAGEAARLFAEAGATNLLPTKLDLCRRVGGLLTAAEEGGFRLGYASVSASLNKGLVRFDAPSLARLLLA